jgi:outer membrane protein TolC
MSKRLCIAATALLAGCAAGPDYHRPSLDVPPQYRDTAPATTGASRINNEDQVQILASYQLDLWGQLRRMNEAARANLLASQYARRAVSVTLVATLANAYFELISLDSQLEITRRTVVSREKFVELTHAQHERRYAGFATAFRAICSATQLGVNPSFMSPAST